MYVTRTNSASNVTFSTTGRYAAIDTNTLTQGPVSEPLYTTASQKAFWTAVLASVQALIAAGPDN